VLFDPKLIECGMSAVLYRRYLLGVLLVIQIFNYLDRPVLALALQQIKVDLSLSDTQLGFLSGIAFALFYSIMGLPIARWADRGNRVMIIALTTAIWSFMVALCGMAGSFAQLLLIRVGVAVGEAGCIPPAHSLIADYFDRSERPRALGIYMLGGPLSIVVGFFLAGWLTELYGWRVTFGLLGLPGLALAALAWLSLREPRSSTGVMSAPPQPSLREGCACLWANRTFRHLLVSFAVLFFFGQGIWQWQPAYFVRVYGLSAGQLGTSLAVTAGLAGVLGTLTGGELASRIAGRDERLQMRAMAVGFASYGVISACVFLVPNYRVAFVLVALANFGGALANGPLFATIQTVVLRRMRAMSIAIIYLVANLIGMGLGPLSVGVLSDAWRPWAGEQSLRYALLSLCPGYLWGAWHVWQGSHTVTQDA